MEMATLGWILAGWFAVSIVVSLFLGRFLREVNAEAGESDLNQVLSRRQVVRFMRGRKPAVAAVRPAVQSGKIRRSGH